MLLGNKKTQENDQNWCVVLNPLSSEIDKKRVAEKITRVFSLSSEEARDLVANTPIILLDNLTHTVAARVKDYFRSSGAELILTNDLFLKRKCYRTVWPEPPSLAFLRSLPDRQAGLPDARPTLASSRETERSLGPEEALNEIKSLSKNPPKDFDTPLGEAGLSAVEAAQSDPQDFSVPIYSPAPAEREPKEKEIRELRALLANADERCEILKEEARQTRSVLEEKLALANQENEKWKQKVNEITERLEEDQARRRQTESLRQAQDEALSKAVSRAERAEERERESEKAQVRAVEELEIRTRELDSAKRELREAASELARREALQKKSQLAGRLAEKEALLKALVKEQERVEGEIREREEAIRSILAEQEKVEREMMEARQAERHWMGHD